MRFMLVGICLVLTVSACGGGEITLTEYVERVNAIHNRADRRYGVLVASQQGAVLVAEPTQLAHFIPRDLQTAFEQVREIEIEVMEAVDNFEPPEQIADLHHSWFSDEFTKAEAALATRAGTAVDWEELSATPEMAAYRAVLAADKQLCTDLQARLDATAERRGFGDTAWIPSELKEVVEAVLGCEVYPEHPEDVYRPPPASTS